jgi:hypothetical protein
MKVIPGTRLSIDKKVKTGLEETRLLMLGGVILLGFQFHGVFQDGFAELSPIARALNGLALMLMVLAIALLVAPSARHRIVEGGHSTRAVIDSIGMMAGWALLPFGLSLGLAIFVALDSHFGVPLAAAAGAAFSSLALWFWYGLEFRERARQKKANSMPEALRHQTPLSARIDQMLTEARVFLPGAQALLGFQLTIALSKTFAEIPPSSKLVHAAALGCMALAIVLLMAPAAYHRIVYRGEDTEEMHRIGSRFIVLASVPIALGVAGDVYVTIERIAQSSRVAIVAGLIALAIAIGLWHAYPLALRRRRLPASAKRDRTPRARRR